MSDISILGMCLCERRSGDLLVMMLNAGFRPELNFPHHLQTLVATKAAVASTTTPPLPSLKGRLDDTKFTDAAHLGWDLAGCVVKVAGGAGAPGSAPSNPFNPTHPDPAIFDFSDMHWVMSAQRALPGATINPEARTPGALTAAIATFTGGTIKGGAPNNGADAMNIWHFIPGVTQAVTDTLHYSPAAAPYTIRIEYPDGTLRGEIQIGSGGKVFLINEATPRDNLKDAEKDVNGRPSRAVNRHITGYYEALKNLPKHKPVAIPVDKIPDAPAVQAEGTFCIVMLA